MRLSKVLICGYRSLPDLQFEAAPFTVLFGKNNAGKTNLLEAIYGVIASHDPMGNSSGRVLRDGTAPHGAIYVDLEPGLAFDDTVLAATPEWAPVPQGVLRFRELPPGQVCFARADRVSELWFTDVGDYFEQRELPGLILNYEVDDDGEPGIYEIDQQARSSDGPRLGALFLGWEFGDIDHWVTSAMDRLSAVPDRMHGTGGGFAYRYIPGRRGCLELVDGAESSGQWQVRPEVHARLDQLANLATDLLPDFLDGAIRAKFQVPTGWHDSPRVRIEYEERDSGNRRSLQDFGRGASRWLAIAVQVALQIMESDWVTSKLPVSMEKAFSGQVLLVDEPEAHLHPSAVASIVRWCQRMVKCGFQIVAASHHEEFLRASGSDIRFVKVSRGITTSTDATGKLHRHVHTRTRTVLSTATAVLQELAAEVGMHPAAAFALHRAILFVEGPLDEAVLDEYAGSRFDAAGVVMIPIHGTKNLEGLIDGEFTTRLGIKAGVLTDNTQTATIWDRSNRKRSSEEIKIVRLINRFQEQGLPPPDLFGVPEDDLLFALPTAAVRDYLNGPFPDWQELREECRAAQGLGPSDSADWKSYAHTHYGLPLTTASGVRKIVRYLDLAGTEMPSIQAVVEDIIAWAMST
ncbi:hypothetical protein BST27_29495 [Mycobacterium intermedium]|uniref:ATPase AAA-type core domain-containing protein n=1 Tax=Mycobacterium intermedium TaxID=28445 RepID=A0A1E3S1M4_MYCIE|nr:ATP-binding protein [Mycobacterium intermedium]MCV6966072.1 AAA family ATPase [Mycobacterium intermedium]ODQ95998.1 hypothetical protein BHQ20_29075 [Mycobacterium intermedium]OPE45170.1 hypothetical protein BV508_30455 [Mycobacterium intermedium]ORA91519.1 hypothetical protein BST27_29495 [Mycobacterium intermedium]